MAVPVMRAEAAAFAGLIGVACFGLAVVLLRKAAKEVKRPVQPFDRSPR